MIINACHGWCNKKYKVGALMGLPLQKALIDSLTSLRENSPFSKEITSYITELQKENIVIRKSDYGAIISMVLLMANHLPGVLDNQPHNEALKALCRHCVQQFNLLVELKVKASTLRKTPLQTKKTTETESNEKPESHYKTMK